MSDEWTTVQVLEVRPGDRVRLASGVELEVSRVESPFLGREDLVCLIEDTPTRWYAQPVPADGALERLGPPA